MSDDLRDFFSEISKSKKEKKKKLEEAKEELKSIVGDLGLDSLFKDFSNIKKEQVEKKKEQSKKLEAYENFFSNIEKPKPKKVVEEPVEEAIEEPIVEEQEIEEINEEELEKEIEEVKEDASLIEKSLGMLAVTDTNEDPLTPLDKKFATFEEFQNHYVILIQRIQQQLSTLGGGGEVNFKRLDDVTWNGSDDNGKFLKYNSTTEKFEFATVSGGGGGGSIAGIDTTGTSFFNNLNVTGITTIGNVVVGSATTDLIVNGDVRVTGILTIGQSSLKLDGTNNIVNVGTALTLGHTNGIQFHTQNLHASGFEVNNINASGIITASSLDISGNVDIDGTTNLDAVDIDGNTDFGGDVTFDGATAGRDIVFDRAESELQFADNSQIVMGAGEDFRIYHDGYKSIIQHGGHGDLHIRAGLGEKINFQKWSGGDTLADFNTDGSIDLYYDAVKRFSTSGIGATVFGQLDTTTLNVSGVSTITNRIDIKSDDGTSGRIHFYCESNNAHYLNLQAPPHSDFSGNVTTILPTKSGDLIVGDTSGTISQNINTSGIITASSFGGSGSSLTGLTGASSGTYGDSGAIPIIAVNSDGKITGITTAAASSGGGGDANQNAFSNVAVAGQTTVAADSATDTLTLVAGSNVTLTTNDGADSVTIAASGGGGGGGSPGGSNTQIQYNNSSSFGGVANLTFDGSALGFSGMVKEGVNIVANKLSAATDIDVEDGHVHMFTTNETADATPNIRYNSSAALNTKMSIGDVITLTIIAAVNNINYTYDEVTIDGGAQTELWLGGSAPQAGGTGNDVYTYTIIKTADATFTVMINVVNFTA